MTMEMALGMNESEAVASGYRGTDQGSQMKMDYGWHLDENGTNSSGFSGLPSGHRAASFSSAGAVGAWWTSSSSGSNVWSRYLYANDDRVYRSTDNQPYGFSVRCVRDAE